MPDSPWKKHERMVAVLFSRWLAQGVTGVEADRVLSRQALHGRMVERLHGDLAIHPKCSERMRPAAEWFMRTFQVDAKNRKAFRLPGLLTGAKHPFWEWWDKLSEETPRYRTYNLPVGPGETELHNQGKVRMMVILNNPSKERLLVLGFGDGEFYEGACGKMHDAIPTFEISKVMTHGTIAVKIVVLEDFLAWTDPVALGCPRVEVGDVPEEAEPASP